MAIIFPISFSLICNKKEDEREREIYRMGGTESVSGLVMDEEEDGPPKKRWWRRKRRRRKGELSRV